MSKITIIDKTNTDTLIVFLDKQVKQHIFFLSDSLLKESLYMRLEREKILSQRLFTRSF